MNATLRIPTKEPYAYIELHVEGDAQLIVQTYLNVTDTYLRMAKQHAADKPPF